MTVHRHLLAILSLLALGAAAAPPTDPRVLIREAAARGQRRITIPPGEYRFGPGGFRGELRFEKLADIEIDATGVTLLREDPDAGQMIFAACRNVTLRGLTIVNRRPAFTQGVITAADPAGKFVDVRLHEGYPADLNDRRRFSAELVGYVFDPRDRQWKTGAIDHYFRETTPLGQPGRFRLWLRKPAREGLGAVGDLMAMRGLVRGDVRIHECGGMKIIGLTIRAGSGFCLHEDRGEGGNYYERLTVTYGERPEGAAESPLLACVADAFHSSSTRRGPTLIDCNFEGMPDDGVAIHGSYGMIFEAGRDNLIVAFNHNRVFFRAGDPFQLLDEGGSVAAEARVLAVTPAAGYTPPRRPDARFFDTTDEFFQLRLDRPVEARFGRRFSNPQACGRGYVVRGCTIRNHRARGLLLKADDGLVENNHIDGSTMGGIVLAPEFYWNEAGYSRQVTIRNNVIRRVAYASTGRWANEAGGVVVSGAMPGAHGHRDIRIENNTFEEIDAVNLLVRAAEGVVISGNRFERPHRHPSVIGADRIASGTLIWLENCRDMRMENNTLLEPGGYLRQRVASRAIQEFTGEEKGLRPAAP